MADRTPPKAVGGPVSGGASVQLGADGCVIDPWQSADRTPPPVPPAALEAAAAAMEAAEEEHFSAEPGGWVIDRQTYMEQARTALEAAAPILLAAGRKQAAADIRQKINDWRPQANTSLYALDVLSLAAEIAEGKTDG